MFMKYLTRKIYFKFVIFIILIFFSVINMNSQADNTDDIKKKAPFSFDFYNKEKFIFEFDGIYHYTNLLRNEVDFSFKFPFRYYALNFGVNEKFFVDFNQIQISKSEEIIDTPTIISNMLNNYFSTGIDNKIKLKPIMNIYLNYENGIITPFNDYLSFIINPITLRFEGDYYFGFNWEIEGAIPITITPQIQNDIVFSPSMYFKLAYEFFRFYGPRKFKFTIVTDDYLTISIPYSIYDKTYENNFKAGMIFNFFGISPSIFFILDTTGDVSTREISNNYIGLKTGISLYINRFIFSVDYSGYTDVTLSYGNWINRFDAYFKFIITYERQNKSKTK